MGVDSNSGNSNNNNNSILATLTTTWRRFRDLVVPQAERWVALSVIVQEQDSEDKESEDGQYEENDENDELSPKSKPRFTKEQIKAIVQMSMGFLCIVIASILYTWSLEGGDVGWLHDNLSKLSKRILFAIFLYFTGFILLFCARRRVRKLIWYPFMGAISIVLIFAIWGRDRTTTLEHHGLYNLIVLVMVSTIVLTIMGAWFLSVRFLGWKKAIILHLVILNGIFLFFFINNVQIRKDWQKGLFGRHLEYNNVGCDIPTSYVPFPAYVPEGWLRFCQECPSQQPHFAYLKGDILTIECEAPNTPHYVEYPDFMRDRPLPFSADDSELIKYGNMSQIIYNYTGPSQTFAEVVQAFCGSESELLVRNRAIPSILEDAKTHSKNFSPEKTELPHPPNVLVLFIDAISRAHAHRRMEKTMQALTDFQDSGTMDVYEFFKYHAIQPYTGPNTIPLYAGIDKPEVKYDLKKWPLWWNTFDEQYAKAWIYGTCEDWMKTYIQTEEFPYANHTLIMPFCHPDAYPLDDPHGPFKGPYSMCARCIGDKHVHQIVMQYTKEYFANYKGIGKIASLSFMEAHEGSLEVVRQLDKDLPDFLNSLQDELNNTFIFIVADHGNHMSPFYLWTRNGKLESRLPALFMLTPKWFSKRYPEKAANLAANQNRLISAFDVHDTFLQLRELPEFNQNITVTSDDVIKGLFRVISEDRDCKDAHIPEDICVCHNSVPTPIPH